MRLLALLLGMVLVAGLGWLTLREGGWLDQVTEQRVEDALLGNGMPAAMAQCMAPRLTEQLSIAQLRKLERLGPGEGETEIPGSVRLALERLERVDDPDAMRVLASAVTSCGVDSLLDRLR